MYASAESCQGQPFREFISYTYKVLTNQNKYKHYIPIKDISSSEVVIQELEKLDILLSQSDLQQFAYFNQAYISVTRAINSAQQAGEFQNSAVIKRLEVAFAHRYFEALNLYAKHRSMPGLWNSLLYTNPFTKRSSSLQLMLGAKAHINYDLLPALEDQVLEPDEFAQDFALISQLLLTCSHEVLNNYAEPIRSLNFLKQKLAILYHRPAMWAVIRWRTKVWKQFTTNQDLGVYAWHRKHFQNID